MVVTNSLDSIEENLVEPIPQVSVIIPSLDGSRGRNVPKLLDELSHQTIQLLDVHVVKGVTPNGRARNEGVEQAKGEFLVFIDDDVRLGHERIIENLIKPLQEDETIGMTGVSITLPPDSSWFQRMSAKQLPRFQFPIMDKIIESDMVTTACCAISKDLFQKSGRFNEKLERGVDPEFRYRVRKAGYKIVIVPKSWFYHPMPQTLWKLIKISFRNGSASAHAKKNYPDLVFEAPDKHLGSMVETKPFWKRTFRFGWKFMQAIITCQFIYVLTRVAYLFGYICNKGPVH